MFASTTRLLPQCPFHLSYIYTVMANFASLPSELIYEIFRLVPPEDFENFAQMSRNVQALALPFLTEHRSLIRKYHTLRNNTGSDSIAALLSTMLGNPRLGSYAREADFDHLTNPKLRTASMPVYTKEELDVFPTAALNSECLKKPSEEDVLDEKEFWLQKIEDGNEGILLAILLHLLPNLVKLSVGKPAFAPIEWYDSAIQNATFASKPTLSKLSQIRLKTSEIHRYPLKEIQRFCALPSVRTLVAPMASGDRTYLSELMPDTPSNVTHLKLWESCIDSQALYEFLRAFRKLQTFTYSHIKFSPPRVFHDVFLIRSSLLAHCKATLQSLTLLSPNSRSYSFMGSLRGFDALREIYTEWSFFISNTNRSGLQLNENMPASLVRLKLHDSYGREQSEYEGVIKSAQYAKEHRLKDLKWLVFGGILVEWSLETIDRGLRKTSLNLGITLIFSPYAPRSGD